MKTIDVTPGLPNIVTVDEQCTRSETISSPAGSLLDTIALHVAQPIPIGFAELDDHGLLINANARFFELSSKLGRGAPVAAAMDAESGARIAKLMEEISQHPDQATHMDGGFMGPEPRSAALTLSAVGEGRVSVFAIDKTESKMLEAQLAQSQKMQAIGQLASGLAHDFNNMLTPIIGFADLLLAKMRPTDPSFQDVMSIKQNANRAAGLVRHLLALQRNQSQVTSRHPSAYTESERSAARHPGL